MISAKSEMPSVSLFADESQKAVHFYKHYVPTARFRLDLTRIERFQNVDFAQFCVISCGRPYVIAAVSFSDTIRVVLAHWLLHES